MHSRSIWRGAAASFMTVALAAAGVQAADAVSDVGVVPVSAALVGSVPPGAAIRSVSVYALPTDAALRKMRRGEERPLALVAEPDRAKVDGHAFRSFFTPDDVPRAYVGEGGVVHLQTLVVTDRGTFGTLTSARAFSIAGSRRAGWASANDTSAVSNRKVAASSGVLPAAAGLGSADVRPLEAVRFMPMGDAGKKAVGGSTKTGEPSPPAGCSYKKLKKKVRKATFATTYPARKGKGGVTISSSTGADYGIAVSTLSGEKYGAFKAGSSKYTRSDWSASWKPVRSSRSYQKGIEYGLYELHCARGCWGCTRSWIPTGETGGTDHNDGIARPNFKKCQRVTSDTWSRDRAGGKAYSYGAAVKFASLIGIDLSISRNYNKSQKIDYVLPAPRRMCGNNAWPSTAGKVMMK
ncbi:hypothetical protein [Nocardioides daphniae]|uniref:Uncharacterized protein n=1 Tax=Nocardioides daphniae TaxID=402297 RepID=A0A4P7U945_9ACTN|nr:hypothetical protein [Nocardioides daphniae]QCC76141.1 hypothetical protein E2C04_01080 [Nocardioides daphniae]GGD09702.1 hypothetical protein GCM10007231_05710 [Nocardioides daphniae]